MNSRKCEVEFGGVPVSQLNIDPADLAIFIRIEAKLDRLLKLAGEIEKATTLPYVHSAEVPKEFNWGAK